MLKAESRAVLADTSNIIQDVSRILTQNWKQEHHCGCAEQVAHVGSYQEIKNTKG
jgi:hypothetical protein